MRDSVRVAVRVVRERVIDTAFVELPVVVERVAVLDTVSVLENAFAASRAEVSAGVLRHSLETRPSRLPVAVEREVVFRDSVVFRDRVVLEEVCVGKPLTGWQRVRMKVGDFLLIFAFIEIIYFIIKYIFNINFFKL